jgi:hypothetical protein
LWISCSKLALRLFKLTTSSFSSNAIIIGYYTYPHSNIVAYVV